MMYDTDSGYIDLTSVLMSATFVLPATLIARISSGASEYVWSSGDQIKHTDNCTHSQTIHGMQLDNRKEKLINQMVSLNDNVLQNFYR